jgi:prepilin-type N-terminal cleavage/methylation domain-containing protein
MPVAGSRHGFTLIELMVVMLLITIVLAVVIPRFDTGAFQDPVKKLSRWMITSVRTLRSAAIQKQKVQELVIDLSDHRMWLANEDMDEDALAAAADKGITLPDTVRIADVQYPGQDRISSGTTQVKFYPAGYADQALIHLETDDARKFTYLVEPLLPKIKFFDKWIEF